MIDNYDKLTISQRDSISAIVNDATLYEADKDMQILKVLGFDPDTHGVLEVGEALETAKFLLTPCPERKMKSFQYDGYTFKVPQFGDISYAQYVDLCSSTDNAGLLKAICVPEGHKYGEVDIDFSNLHYPTAASVINPFMNSLRRRARRSLGSFLLPIKVRAMLCKRYRERVSSVASIATSVLHSLSSTRFI